MNSAAPPNKLVKQLRDMNEALLISSVKQHELAEQARKSEAALRDSVELLRQSHAYIESIVATVREPLLVLNKNLRVRTASRSFYVTFHLRPEDTENRLLYELGNGQWNNPDLRRLLEEILLRDTQVNDFEVEHQFEHIGRRAMRLNARRLIQATDQAPLILLAIEDVTESAAAKKALRESEQRLRFIMDSAPQKIFTAKPNGDVDYLNPIWMEYTGLPFEQIKGWGWKQFIHPDDLAENVRVWRHSIDTSEPFQFEHRFRRTDGEYCWHLSRASPMRDEAGRVVMWIGSNTDIHEQRQTANQLRQYAADMSMADHRKDEFLAMLAHELRNPLAPISNAVHILRLQKNEDQIQKQARTIIDRQVTQLTRLVDDLMEVSRINTGRVQLRHDRVVVNAIVEHAVETARPLLDQRRHELTVALPADPIWLNADASRLEQVVVNLLTNAAKYTDEGGHIWLTVELADEKATRWQGGKVTEEMGSSASPHLVAPSPCQLVTIRVRDTGVGIARELLPRIFDLFTQAERTLDRSQGGLGIGLALVQRLVEMHGGNVEVFSALGQGSEFVVRLPVAVSGFGVSGSGEDVAIPHSRNPEPGTRNPEPEAPCVGGG